MECLNCDIRAKENIELHKEIDHLTASLAERDAEIEYLNKKVTKLKACIESWVNEFNVKHQQLTASQQDVEELKFAYKIARDDASEARQEAARECMRICDDLEDEGYHYETCCHLTVRDRIKAKFGLEG